MYSQNRAARTHISAQIKRPNRMQTQCANQAQIHTICDNTHTCSYAAILDWGLGLAFVSFFPNGCLLARCQLWFWRWRYRPHTTRDWWHPDYFGEVRWHDLRLCFGVGEFPRVCWHLHVSTCLRSWMLPASHLSFTTSGTWTFKLMLSGVPTC